MFKKRSLHLELGVSLLEYAIIIAILGAVVLGVYQEFVPRSSSFYSDVADGFSEVYPKGYWSSS